MVHGVIFDCDGVLVNTESIVIDIEISAMAGLGVTYDREDFIRKYLGCSEPDFETGLDADCRSATGSGLPEGFFEALETRRVAALARDVAAIPGVHDFASSLECSRAVASSSRRDVLAMKLRKTGLAPLFGAQVHSGDDVANGKPAPDLFLLAARGLGKDPAHCLAIEDSVSGVRSARSAGMTVWGFTGGGHCPSGHGTELASAGAASVFEDFGAIGAAFRSLVR